MLLKKLSKFWDNPYNSKYNLLDRDKLSSYAKKTKKNHFHWNQNSWSKIARVVTRFHKFPLECRPSPSHWLLDNWNWFISLVIVVVLSVCAPSCMSSWVSFTIFSSKAYSIHGAGSSTIGMGSYLLSSSIFWVLVCRPAMSS